MLGGQIAARQIVAAHRAVKLLGQLRAPYRDGHATQGQLVELVVVAPLANDDQALGPPSVVQTGQGVQALGVHAREQHVVACIGQCISNATQYGQEERV